MKIALYVNRYNNHTPESLSQICKVCDAIHQHSISLYIQDSAFDSMPRPAQDSIRKYCLLFDTLPPVDMVFSVGGDGTFLRTASEVGNSNIPILGINTGRLGFLADISPEHIDEVLDEIVAEDFCIEERVLLQLSAEESLIPKGFNLFSLNEVAIMKQDTSSMLTIHAYIDDIFLSTYQADGLVIATPTGSTAYSLSIGGPILVPTSPSIILNAIAPHSLTSRPLVINDYRAVKFKVESRNQTFLVSVDGQSFILNEKNIVEIRKANHSLKIVKRKNHTFFETLREKLMWGQDARLK